MIDTIRVKFVMALEPQLFEGWISYRVVYPNDFYRERRIYNTRLSACTSHQGAEVRCTYVPIDRSGKPILVIEFSLPNLLYGSNVNMVTDIRTAVEEANRVLLSDPKIPSIDLRHGYLLRLDCCINHQVGQFVQAYTRALSGLEYPHRKTRPYKGEGVQFKSESVNTYFYDKAVESGDSMAEGMLRHETSLLNARTISTFSGKKRTTLVDISEETIVRVLQQDLKRLKINDKPIGPVDMSLQVLVDKYGEHAGVYYYGFLKAKYDLTKKGLGRVMKCHPRSLDHRLKKIVDAGLAPTLTETMVLLPPLTIGFGDRGGLCPKVFTNSLRI
jgi:hypothetical protein